MTKLRTVMSCLALLLVVIGGFYRYRLFRERTIWASYERARSEYAQSIPLDWTRAEVENSLAAKGKQFTTQCCDYANGTFDLVKIGEFRPPWDCSRRYIYVAFHFRNSAPPLTSSADLLR